MPTSDKKHYESYSKDGSEGESSICTMILSRTERFKIKSRLVEEMEREPQKWNYRKTNMLLGEFGLEQIDDSPYDGPMFEDVILNISDSDLLEMYPLVTGEEPENFHDMAATDDPGNWKPGYVRLFLSHSEEHKEFVGKIADELAVVGIHGFVAPHMMTHSKPWQDQIEQALWSMQAFVAIVHSEFQNSAWCHQEVGWALGRRVHRYAVRLDADPDGFIARTQWPSMPGATPKDIAKTISEWVSSLPDLGESMTAGLFASLEASNDYVSAGAAAQRIAALGSLTDDQWDRLDKIFWMNDQIRGGVLPNKALKPFYQEHRRSWPPPKADEGTARGSFPLRRQP